jgi:hypothetical protein
VARNDNERIADNLDAARAPAAIVAGGESSP